MHSPRKTTSLALVSVICLLAGLFIAGIIRGWIIIQLPTQLTYNQAATAEQRACTLWLHKDANWHQEQVLCVAPHETTAALQQLISSWVSLVNEEKILTQELQLTSALLGDEHVAYLSFEQSPFSREESTHARWLFIESLLRTIRDNLPQLTSVMLLVNHKPLVDRHLDFSKPWPTRGFLET